MTTAPEPCRVCGLYPPLCRGHVAMPVGPVSNVIGPGIDGAVVFVVPTEKHGEGVCWTCGDYHSRCRCMVTADPSPWPWPARYLPTVSGEPDTRNPSTLPPETP